MRTVKQIEQTLWRKLSEAAPTAGASKDSRPGTDVAMDQFKQGLIGAESGGRNVKNKKSSATGLGQFLKGTFQGMAAQAKPGSPLYGKTWDDYKKDLNLQRQTLDIAVNSYTNALNRNKLPVTAGNLYMMHHFGPGRALKMISSPNAKLGDFIPATVTRRNKKTGQIETITNPVYAKNPKLNPEQTVSFTQQRLASAVQSNVDKQTQLAKNKTDDAPKSDTRVAQVTTPAPAPAAVKKADTQVAQAKPVAPPPPAAVKKTDTQVAQAAPAAAQKKSTTAGKLADLGNRALAAVTGSTSAHAGELPADKRAAFAKPPVAPVAATGPATDRFKDQPTQQPTVDTGEIRAAGGLDAPEPPKDWWDQIDHSALSVASSDDNDDEDDDYEEVPSTPTTTVHESSNELNDILRLAGRVK